MTRKAKDRLLTAGTVLVICSMAVVLPGCATNPEAGGGQPTSTRKPYHERCHTDIECKMESRSQQQEPSQSKWKLWTSIGIGVLVTGYLYAHEQDNGGDLRSTGSGFGFGDKGIQPVVCGSECAR